MTDRILISDLRFFAHHGLHPEEEALGQRFIVSLVLELDLSKAGTSDAMEDSVHYGEVVATTEAIVTQRRFKLIEALADAIAGTILERFPLVERITVRVEKPGAPIPIATGLVAVEIERGRA
ncbi:dihydroneopterin aldolase [Kaistia algarum]|uniref:dihydroneopterin aldolase n=1 Tax=Kaistia algarum TaxID=2083279 RepID=UPI000CE8AC54|nr:dihydroneopterin aldolase [Kaistia algarum]MCX5515272.1 dihydroneopterin aldolase [Kaistia algarum]PPE77710.1 dihydroneopterin aldolase [Kaistia algarum]